jgi:hypothetical protein
MTLNLESCYAERPILFIVMLRIIMLNNAEYCYAECRGALTTTTQGKA